LQGHPSQPQMALALQDLREACAFFKLLGSYPIDAH
jgi:chorismate mutase/prephenate dehydratase